MEPNTPVRSAGETFWHRIASATLTSDERVILSSLMILSTQLPYKHLTPEAIYDELVRHSLTAFASGAPDLNNHFGHTFLLRSLSEQLDRMERDLNTRDRLHLAAFESVLNKLKPIGENVADNKTAISRLQSDVTALQGTVSNVKTSVDAVGKGVSDESTTLAAIAQQLRDAAGSGDADAINAIADSIEGVKANLDGHATTLTNLAAQAEQASTAATAQPVTLTISPSTVSLPPGGTQLFTASGPATFAAQSGTIDASGNYTAGDGTVPSDTVTATSTTDPSVSASASVTISA